MVRALICSSDLLARKPAMFHGDPHAGNLFLTDDNRLAILDWSLVGSLGSANGGDRPNHARVQSRLMQAESLPYWKA